MRQKYPKFGNTRVRVSGKKHEYYERQIKSIHWAVASSECRNLSNNFTFGHVNQSSAYKKRCGGHALCKNPLSDDNRQGDNPGLRAFSESFARG
jgi:hypothetical protein